MKVYVALLSIILIAACARDTSIGGRYLGVRYLNNPLGEGAAPDTDPLVRFDAFDCTTFVETALANGDMDKLIKIRYKNGKVDFINRNHFIETDWLPNNSDLIENVSIKYGKTAKRTVKINRARWMQRVHNVRDTTPIKSVNLDYIPYSNLGEINNSEPLIVLFVLAPNHRLAKKYGTDLAVHHMGFLLPGGKTLRHASSGRGAVVDVNFNEYVAKRQNSANNLGVILLEIKK